MDIALESRPLVAHVVYRFDVGGLENGIVNLINAMPKECYRHVVIALTDITEFKRRIARSDVDFIALNKPLGHAVKIYPQLVALFRRLKPAIVHTRNLGALETVVPAWIAGVPVRIHGEHGRDVGDLDGTNRKYQWVRQIYRPFVNQYIALSCDLERYLIERIGISQHRVAQIYNGVDTRRFYPARERGVAKGCPFRESGLWLVGTVGRMQEVKDQLTLARAFVRALEIDPAQRKRLRLVMIGEGPLRVEAKALLAQAGVEDLSWLPGERGDIPTVLQGLDCFVMPSMAEGISNTILEAMASALPVIATNVGGNPELIAAGRTGELVALGDSDTLAKRILAYARDTSKARQAGREGRQRVEHWFSLDTMVKGYQRLYDELLATKGGPAALPGGQ